MFLFGAQQQEISRNKYTQTTICEIEHRLSHCGVHLIDCTQLKFIGHLAVKM